LDGQAGKMVLALQPQPHGGLGISTVAFKPNNAAGPQDTITLTRRLARTATSGPEAAANTAPRTEPAPRDADGNQDMATASTSISTTATAAAAAQVASTPLRASTRGKIETILDSSGHARSGFSLGKSAVRNTISQVLQRLPAEEHALKLADLETALSTKSQLEMVAVVNNWSTSTDKVGIRDQDAELTQAQLQTKQQIESFRTPQFEGIFQDLVTHMSLENRGLCSNVTLSGGRTMPRSPVFKRVLLDTRSPLVAMQAMRDDVARETWKNPAILAMEPPMHPEALTALVYEKTLNWLPQDYKGLDGPGSLLTGARSRDNGASGDGT